MTTPTFENAKNDYQAQKTAYLAALEKIPNQDPLSEDMQKKIAYAKQLSAFAFEQERYFDAFVKNREDAVQYVQSVTGLFTLATEILTDLEGVSSEEKKDKETTVDPTIPKAWDYYDKKLIQLARAAPGEPNFLKFGIKFTLGFVLPIVLAIILMVFVSPAALFLLIPLILVPVFVINTDIGKRMLDRDLRPQPGSLSEQIDYLRIPPEFKQERVIPQADPLSPPITTPKWEYYPRRLPGLDGLEMQHEYAPEFWYKQGKAKETASPVVLPASSSPEHKG